MRGIEPNPHRRGSSRRRALGSVGVGGTGRRQRGGGAGVGGRASRIQGAGVPRVLRLGRFIWRETAVGLRPGSGSAKRTRATCFWMAGLGFVSPSIAPGRGVPSQRLGYRPRGAALPRWLARRRVMAGGLRAPRVLLRCRSSGSSARGWRRVKAVVYAAGNRWVMAISDTASRYPGRASGPCSFRRYLLLGEGSK